MAGRPGREPHLERPSGRDRGRHPRHPGDHPAGRDKRRDSGPRGGPYHAGVSVPYRRLRCGQDGEPLWSEARPAGAPAGTARDAGTGERRSGCWSERHGPAQQRYASAGSDAQRRAGHPAAAEPGHDLERLGDPEAARPVLRWGHRWRVGPRPDATGHSLQRRRARLRTDAGAHQERT